MIVTNGSAYVHPAWYELEQQLHGQLILPGQAGYDTARAVWNGMIDRYPAAIARCAGIQDVVAAVNYAREHELVLAVRGGGHNVAGHGTCDGGLVIDLADLNTVEVDPINRIARAGGGTTWGQLDAATQVYGLATPGGVFSDTGIAGLTLGGGFGYLRSKYGLACDNLVGAELVTAAGEVIRVSERENAELLWGLRGGGGNFGVVTTFEYRLHPVGPDVQFVFVFHDAEGDNMRRAVELYRDYSAGAPDEVSSILALGVIPPDPHVFPEAIHGRPFAAFIALYAGPVEQGKAVLQPLLDFGAPLLDGSGAMQYVEAQKAFDHDYPDGRRYYWKSLNLLTLDDAAIETIVEHARRQVSPFSTTDLWHIGGAMQRVGAAQSAFYGRHAAYLLNPEANWDGSEGDAANVAWVQQFIAAMQPWSDGSRYLNFAGFQEEGDAMMRDSWGAQYERLRELKATYDPTNLFSLNQNIKPRQD